MKKILLINGSSRKKNTLHLLKSVENILVNEGFKCEIINLYEEDIKFCSGCKHCILNNGCIIKDDCNNIMKKIIDCDGLVIGTPVYLNNMSGILKTFFDRTCSWFHRSPVSMKPTLLLANTQGSGIKCTLNSIKEIMIQWGVYCTDSISRNGRNFNKEIRRVELINFIKLLKSDKKTYIPSFKEIYTYNVQRALATNIFSLDKKYWEENNWINNVYFNTAKVSVIKKLYGSTIYKILCSVIKPIK